MAGANIGTMTNVYVRGETGVAAVNTINLAINGIDIQSLNTNAGTINEVSQNINELMDELTKNYDANLDNLKVNPYCSGV